MNNPKILLKVTLLSCILFLILTVGDFAMMHDIRSDYVSQSVFKHLKVTLPDLPEWTNTTGEWKHLYWSHFLKLFFSGLGIVALSWYTKKATQA